MAPFDNRLIMTREARTPVLDSPPLIAALFALIPIPVAVADEDGHIVLANSSFSEVFQGLGTLSDVPQREISVPEYGAFEVQTLPLNDSGFRFIYAREVTAQIQLGRQLEEMEKLAAIGRVVKGIAHELHNPLADILEYIPLIEQCTMDSTARSIVDGIFAAAERAGHLVENLLVLAGTTETGQVPFDLNEIVRNVAVRRGASHSGPAFDIRLELDGNLPRAVGHPSKIEQVITSLLVHAEDAIANAAHNHGSIQIHTGVRAGRVQVQIADNGQSRDTSRIFMPDSSGVGLNTCAEIAKDHGGELYAWSAYGNGSTFTLELPVFQFDGATERDPVVPDIADVERMIRNKSVMAIASELHITELIDDVLTRHGANVRVCNSGAEAYELLYEKEYDLIICDQWMPGLSGENLCRLMTGANPSRHQKFLFMTGDVITVQARQFFAKAGVQYLRKPFRIQDLVEAVGGLFSRNSRQDS